MAVQNAQTAPALRLHHGGVARVHHRGARDAAPGGGAAAATDPRWVLAVRTGTLLEGGRAAVLAPERRARLVRLGEQMGLRAFDANVVIALVQDAARRGEPPLGPDLADRLRMVHAPLPRSGGDPVNAALTVGVVLMLGVAIGVALIRWLLTA